MATNIAISQELPLSEAQVDVQMHEQEQSYLKYFIAAAIFLLVSGLHAFIWRLPPVEQWVRGADYGGRMATTLAQTHITVVAFGTITLTGLIYYLLPRVVGAPLASAGLSNLSFWFTAAGVFAFYCAMVMMGIWEGSLVHEGYTYVAARFVLNGWHQGMLGFAASFMGIGYWTFVWNVLATARAGVRRRHAAAAIAPAAPRPSFFRNLIGLGERVPVGGGEHYFISKFFVAAAVGLFIGTVQGVIQVLPFAVDWLRKTGKAGAQIDPVAHAHINLVGGAMFAMMGFSYYFVPKIVGKPLHSVKLANFSFRFLFTGIFGFYVVLLVLGFVEGDMVLNRGLTPIQAREAFGFFHPFSEAFFAAIMGIGFWSFISNIFMTLADKRPADAPATEHEWLTPAVFLSNFGLLCGTIQGVIQTLPWSKTWLETSGDAGEFITPLAHAQLNILTGVVLSLMIYSMMLIPRLLKRPLFSETMGRASLYIVFTGAALMYLGFVTLGWGIGTVIQQGHTFAEARDIFPGNFLYYVLLISGLSVIGVGYLIYSANVFATIGRSGVAVFFGRIITALSRATAELITVYHRALPKTAAQARNRALTASVAEIILPGAGWFISGRPKMGSVLLLTGTGILFSTIMVIFVMYDSVADIPYLQVLITYILFTIASSIIQYLTYMSQARVHLAARAAARLAPTRTTAEAAQSQVAMRRDR